MFRKIMIRWSPAFLFFAVPGYAQGKSEKIPVVVTVHIEDHADRKDLILYHKNNPLEILDFKGRPDHSSAGVGATYSGILMEMQGQNSDGVLKVNVTLTVYFDKTKSWMKKEGRDDRVLAHEQNHFDLTAIKACALAKAINREKFTADKVQQRIRELQAIHTKELSELQQAYDKETRHGTLAEKQAEWSERISRDLTASECM